MSINVWIKFSGEYYSLTLDWYGGGAYFFLQLGVIMCLFVFQMDTVVLQNYKGVHFGKLSSNRSSLEGNVISET